MIHVQLRRPDADWSKNRHTSCESKRGDKCDDYYALHVLPNVKDEPRPGLARLVLLGARDVTAPVVGSGALFGSVSG